MKKAILAVALAFGIVGCTAERAGVTEEGTETRARLDTERTQYMRDMEARLDRMDEQIEQRREQMRERKLDAQAQRVYDQRMADLERAQREARAEYEEFKNASAETWQDMKQGMDKAADSLEQSWNSFVTDLKVD